MTLAWLSKFAESTTTPEKGTCMTPKQSKVLNGLDGRTAIRASEALTRLGQVAATFGVCGVKLRTSDGQQRNCPLGAGHRPAVTLLQQIVAGNKDTIVFVEVTVAT